ncbi:hypothetical protein ACH3XW_50325 [Acanthocheilonema viteae]
MPSCPSVGIMESDRIFEKCLPRPDISFRGPSSSFAVTSGSRAVFTSGDSVNSATGTAVGCMTGKTAGCGKGVEATDSCPGCVSIFCKKWQ